jgi:ATP-binding cassette subfamily B protein
LARAPSSLEAAIDEAELGDVIARLPGGSQGALGEAGALVSGGEGQRVRFARAICREAPHLVLLDEPFRGLTHDQRSRLLARARERWSRATLLCVTHDLAETLAFPRVLVIAEGRLVEDGAPDLLARQPGSRYAALLEAERRVRSATWAPNSPLRWRRLRMVKGLLDGEPPA